MHLLVTLMRMNLLKRLTLGACLSAFFASPAAAAATAVGEGVVVEEVTRGFAAHAAGLRPGDVILSWSREANPPATPQAARGQVLTPFDLIQVEIEQAPRGRLTLAGLRAGVTSTWVVPQDEWRLNAAPGISDQFAQPYQAGRRLVQAHRMREGVELWRHAARNAKASGQPRLAAWLSLRALEALTGSDDAGLIDESHSDAVAVIAGMQADTAYGETLRSWGLFLLSRNEHEKAGACVNEALASLKTSAADDLTIARVELAVGRVFFVGDRLFEADAQYKRALAVQEVSAPQSAVVADTLSRLAAVELLRSPTRAREYAERAYSIRRAISPSTVGVASALVQLGWAHYQAGDLEPARDSFSRALPLLEESFADGRELAYALVGMGNVRFKRGDFSEADSLLRRALAMYRKLGPEGQQVGTVLISLGGVALRRGDLEMAEAHYDRARAILQGSNHTSTLALALHQLGDLAFARKDFATAASYLQQALSINQSLGNESLSVAFDLACLARALGRQGHFDAAVDDARRSLAIRERLVSGRSYEFSWNLIVLGELALAMGDLDAALRWYEQGSAIRSQLTPASTMAAEPLYGMALVLRRLGRLIPAAEMLSRAVQALEQQGTTLGGGEEARASFRGSSTAPYREYLEVLLELGQPAEAFLTLERSRARALLAMMAERQALFTSDLAPELSQQRQANHAAYDAVQAQLSRLRSGNDDLEIERLQGRLRELREDAGLLVTRIREAAPRVASLAYPQPLDLAGAREALDPGSTLLAYSVGEKETSLFVVQPEGTPGTGLAVFTLPVGQEALREKVERFRRLVEGLDHGSLVAHARELYEILLGPVESALVDSKRLVISPDGPLHVLPFAALARKGGAARTPHYLVEWKPLHVVASATVFAEIKKARHEPTASAPTRVTAFGDPLYPQATSSGEETKDFELRRLLARGIVLSPLPSTREEVRSITSLYPGARSFLGADATEERVKAVAKDASYLHIASHAVLDEGLPLNSALALSIPDSPDVGKDNGLLQAWEIFDGVRMDADLVTLSACKTGLGKDMGGEGLMGLTRAFQYAGARSVVASLWSVADRSTAKLMRRFYGHLAAGRSKDKALRAAQLELLRAGGATAHPRHWAAFELFGDWR